MCLLRVGFVVRAECCVSGWCAFVLECGAVKARVLGASV